jgi:hypothetical protein
MQAIFILIFFEISTEPVSKLSGHHISFQQCSLCPQFPCIFSHDSLKFHSMQHLQNEGGNTGQISENLLSEWYLKKVMAKIKKLKNSFESLYLHKK